MVVAIYKSGPKAGTIASTSDAIIAFPGSREEALSALGYKSKGLPNSLKAALRRKKTPEYPIEFVTPSTTKEIKSPNILNEARLPEVKFLQSPSPIHSNRYTKFTDSELPKIESFLSSHRKFNIEVTPYRSSQVKQFTGTVRIGLDQQEKYLFINDKKSIKLRELGELVLTPLD